MPDWVWVLLAVLALIPFGTFLTVLYQRRQAKSDDKRRLRESGSAAITPVKEFLARVGPLSITWGTDEECDAYLREMQAKWWDEVRPPLQVYANAHPSEAIRELTNDVVEGVQKDIGSTRYLLASRKTAETMESFKASEAAHADALRLVEVLLQKVRDY